MFVDFLIPKKKSLNASTNLYTMNKLHEISPNVGRRFYQISNRWDQIVYTHCRIGHTRMTHMFLILGEDPPKCSFCQNSLSLKHFIISCWFWRSF